MKREQLLSLTQTLPICVRIFRPLHQLAIQLRKGGIKCQCFRGYLTIYAWNKWVLASKIAAVDLSATSKTSVTSKSQPLHNFAVDVLVKYYYG
jgi:hypothetical protein